MRRDRHRRDRAQRPPGRADRGRHADRRGGREPGEGGRWRGSSGPRTSSTSGGGACGTILPTGADHAFECVGRVELIRQAIDLLDRHGQAVLLGVPGFTAEASFLVSSMYLDKSILGCRYGSSRPQRDIALYAELYREGPAAAGRAGDGDVPGRGLREGGGGRGGGAGGAGGADLLSLPGPVLGMFWACVGGMSGVFHRRWKSLGVLSVPASSVVP